MPRRRGRWMGTAALILFTLSCARLPDPGPSESEGVEVELTLRPIPAAWGDLVSVTGNGEPYFQLWFQNDQGAIRAAWFDIRSRAFLPEAEVFPRQ